MTITIRTDHPIADWSPDHKWPMGTANDNSVWPRFDAKVIQRWPEVRLLDLGCAGGGLVRSILGYPGALAVGIDGSDYSRVHQRAEWPHIPGHLFTADATMPFHIERDGAPLLFDVVTAWEFFEHIPEEKLAATLWNVRSHLEPDGVLMASISTIHHRAGTIDHDIGEVEYHATVRPASWWLGFLGALGWELDGELTGYVEPDWVRGPRTGNPSLCAAWRLR